MLAAAEHRRFWWRAAEARTEEPWPQQAAATVVPPAARSSTLTIEPHAAQGGALLPKGSPSELLEISDERRFAAVPAQRVARNRRPLIVLGVASLLGIALFGVLSKGGSVVNAAAPIGEQIDQLLVATGFGVNEVRLTGHRYTVDNDVFRALDLEHTGSLLRLDPENARRRIERLPWIAAASVIRHFPDTLAITVRERKPVALWLNDGRAALVDVSGKVLAQVPPMTLPELPRVTGAGAPEAVGAILKALSAEPELARQIERIERMGQRRWTLRLAQGVRVHLPAIGETEAIARWRRAALAHPQIFDTAAIIDLRQAGRIAFGGVAPTSRRPSAAVRPARSASAM